MYEKVVGMLAALGYALNSGDETIITFCVEKVESTIKNDINWREIPDGAMHIAVNMALGEFLLAKKTFAPDDLTGLDLGVGIKQLTEGDKSTTFSTGESSLTDEQRLDNYISHLLTDGRDELSAFRRIRWG